LPKLRQGRGVYCGSIGYFGFNGQLDLNIAIQPPCFHKARRGSGRRGITARSEPAEYEETLTTSRTAEAFAP
jgi:para-aminobenzoate synthetase component 1